MLSLYSLRWMFLIGVFGMFRETIFFIEEATAECGNINKDHAQQASLVPAGYKEICPYTCTNLDYIVS